ncbi:autotransporter-associated beta strand repeat-containing protein [Roseimicrobium sp. ORNL1]|uniref:beta strand repeat-containing protein n=1 Tax=Roseimicrobium sp. ORNL1 TaxID=2711231 RepID=UPI0013E18899|nr:autotransporter-associated beta strand repeat-containing protein [Roseimicrobium sp. ORNL1]QIF01737.1 PEP-CTERM sorting domain-containing protein [Roseimicrobium sp. ORNL1]
MLSNPLRAALCALLAFGISTAQGANLLFDADPGTAGAQDGSGTWTTGGGNFRNLGTNADNQTFKYGDFVTFGTGLATGSTGNVTVTGTVNTQLIIFAPFGTPSLSSYTITGGTISMSNGIIRLNQNGTINSVLAGTNIAKQGTSTLTLGGNTSNTFTGPLNIYSGRIILNKTSNYDSQLPQAIASGVTVNIGNGTASASLQLSRSHQIADTDTVLNFTGTGITGGVFDLNGFSETVGSIRSTGGGGVIHAGSFGFGNTVSTLTVNNAVDDTYSGVLRDGSTGRVLHFAKANTGKLTLTGTNTYTGDTTVRGGTLEIAGDGALTETGSVVLSTGGKLSLFNTSTGNSSNRVNDAAMVSLRGGTLVMKHDGTVATSTENLGAVTVAAGASTVELWSGIGWTFPESEPIGPTHNELTLASLSRNKGATLSIFGSQVGVEGDRIKITAPPSQDHGIIGGWATVGYEFAAYVNSPVPSVSQLDSSESSGEADWTFEANAKSFGNITLTADRRVNSLNLATSGTTTVNLGGHTLRVESGGLLVSGGTPVTISNGTLTAGTGAGSTGEVILHQYSSGPLDITATIVDNGSHAVALVKSGTGTASLSAANSFTGGVYVNAGTLQVNHANAINSANTLAVEGGTLDLNGHNLSVASLSSQDSNTAGLITNTNVIGGMKTLTAGSDNSSTSFSGQLGDNLNFVKVGTGTLTWNQSNEDYWGVITVAEGTLATGGVGSLGSIIYKTVVQAGATLNVNNGFNQDETLEVAGHGVGGNGALVYGDPLDFLLGPTRDPLSLRNVTLTGHTTLAVHARYDFEDTLAGNGFALTKIGAAELVLEGPSVHHLGDVHAKQGTMTWVGSADLGVSSSTLYVDNNAVVRFQNKANDSKQITLSGGYLSRAGDSTTTTTLDVVLGLRLAAGASTIMDEGGALVFQLNAIQRDVGATLNVDNNPTLATTDTLNDAGGILGGFVTVGGTDWAKNSTNTADGAVVAYTGYVANDFTAAANNVNVTTGTQSATNATVNSLRFAEADTTLNLTGTNTVASGGILITSGAGATISSGTLRGAAGADLVIIQNSTTEATISSVIEDNGSATALTKAGTGWLHLTGNNTYTGGTFITGGTLSVSQIADSGNSNLGNSTSATENTLTFNGGTLNLAGTGTDSETGRNVMLMSGGGTIRMETGRRLEFSGTISGEALLTGEGIYRDDFNSFRTGGEGTLAFSGDGTVVFSGSTSNTYTGQTSIGSTLGSTFTLLLNKSDGATAIAGNLFLGDTVRLMQSHQIADTSLVYMTFNGKLDLAGNEEVIGGLLSSGVVRGSSSTGESGTLETRVAAGATYSFGGVGGFGGGALEDGTGGGTLSYTKSGDGTQILLGANTYTGQTTVSGGVLQLGNGGTTGSLAAASEVVLSGGNLVINRSDNVTFSNAMNGTGTFTVAGTGSVTLDSGNNDFEGNTKVRSGTLYVTNTIGSATGRSAVDVYGTGKLGGTGRIEGAVTVRDGGQITPGNTAAGGTVGTLTLGALTVHRQAASTVPSIIFELGGSGSFIFNDAAGIAANMGNLSAYFDTMLNVYENETGEHDRLHADTMNLDAGAIIEMQTAGYELKAGDVMDLLDFFEMNRLNAPGDRAWSAFQDLYLPTLGAGLSYDLSLFDSNGIVVVVGAVPEPGRAMLLMFGLAGVVLRRRRRV